MSESEPPGEGHNSGNVNNVAADRLKSIVDRIERLQSERDSLTADIRDVYIEAKSAGYDIKVLRTVVRQRTQNAAEISEFEQLLDIYRSALGMLPA